MSASPSGQSNNQTPTPNGGPPQFVRKHKATDPLRPRKKPVRRPNVPAGAAPLRPNGPAPAAPVNRYPVNGILPPRGAPSQAGPANGTADPSVTGGWTNAPTGQYTDFPLFTTKRAMREGLRYHIARFSTKKDVDPANQAEFTRPVVLHRRDPRQPPPGKGIKDEDIPTDDVPMDSKEREKLEILKAEKDARKAADLAQIAPTGNNASALAAKKNQAFRNEKTSQVFRLDKTAEQKKASDLRYEEALPWHLEDADNKNTWVGSYEAALSDTNVMFVIDGARFIMVPIEKWYKFTPKNQFKTYTIEEAEAQLNKKTRESRWVMKANEKKMGELKAPPMHKMYTVKSESNTYKNSSKNERQDMDDLDFEEDDLFQDDDAQVTVEPDNDEDTKDAQEKIKREQLGANIFDQADELEVEKELEKELMEQEAEKKLGKKTRKALTKREQNLIYESDSDHPYSDSSDDDTADEDKQKEIDKRKEEEAKNKAKSESKLPSGASSKGTNTPSGRPKHTDPLKKSKANLKRSGSPNLSESSGNESSRKKLKKKHHASPGASGTSTPVPGSRPMSPAPSGSQPASSQARKSSVVKLNVNPSKLSEIQKAPPNPSPVHGGSMSDGEATGGEMSDGGKKKKLKLRVGSPSGSRAGTPAPGRAGSIGAGGSRAGSPAAQGQSMQFIPPPPILYLMGGFVGDTLQYRFQEKWIMPRRPPQPLEPVFYSVNTPCHTAMKLAIRFHLSQWARAPQSMSFVEWLRVCAAEQTRAQSPGLGPISVQEVIAAIPASGISSGDLMRSFAGRVGDNPGQTDKKAFFSMVKEHSKYSADKLLRPK
ncbi:Transcription initiation factor IIF subunit alpha [Lachnellula willkommii]|uniref:Transcription initiation factor IIF subunit alpha n=1 Tax=Lachnellula willkommii TaxID=215461 RepID=A0A559MK73_9HELO|nr:Transcription initiation factor IIF subunit alpha [Lachnellula willkommii]